MSRIRALLSSGIFSCLLGCSAAAISAPSYSGEIMLNGAESFLLSSAVGQRSIGIEPSSYGRMQRANQLVERAYKAYNDLFSGNGAPSRKQIDRFRSLIAHYERLRYFMLTESQIRRLRQLALQRAGVFGLLSQPLIAQMRLSRRQHSIVNEIATGFHLARLHATADLFRTEGLVSTSPRLVTSTHSTGRLRAVERMRKQRLEALRIEYLDRALAHLSVEQRKTYWALVGAPFRFE